MATGKREDSKFLKSPHQIIQKSGRLTYIIEKKVAKDYPNTCVAMDKVAAAGARDDTHKRKGVDDYSISLQVLLNAFDIFIRENTKGKHSAGWKDNYNLSEPADMTIFLFWQIRHTWTHNGGIIDNKCKTEYDKIIADSIKLGVKPVIDLPDTIDEGYEFTICLDDFKIFTKCIMDYIKKRVSAKDFKILSARQSFTDLKMGSSIYIDFGFGTVNINLDEAYEKGCDVEPGTMKFITPPGARYDYKTERIYFPTGEWISAKKIK